MALVNCVRITRTPISAVAICAVVLLPPLAAADNSQLLSEFRKTRPDVTQVRVLAETPLLVAVTGQQGTRQTPSDWARGELLGVFAHRGDQIVQISMVPNTDFPNAVWIEGQSPDSITFGLADPDYGIRSDNLKIFFDPKTYFPKRMVRFAPVRVHRISLLAGVLSLAGGDGKQDFIARETNGAWRITSSPASPTAAPRPLESVAQITPMPISTAEQFEQARPYKASQIHNVAEINEKIGPYQRVATKIWTGKTFYDGEGSVGVGDVGYFDEAAHDWVFLHIPEMASWSTSALLVEPDTIWVGLVHNGEGASSSGGLLRYDRSTHQASTIPLPDVIDKVVRIGKRLYCGTDGGFAIVDQDQARRFEFTPQLDGSYVITPVT
jgi:hypothetical protein